MTSGLPEKTSSRPAAAVIAEAIPNMIRKARWGGFDMELNLGRRSPAYSLSNVALTFAVAPAPIANVLSHTLKPDFSNLTLWSPAGSLSVEGVLPIYFSSIVISAPSGLDFTSTEESTESALVAGAADPCATVASITGLSA